MSRLFVACDRRGWTAGDWARLLRGRFGAGLASRSSSPRLPGDASSTPSLSPLSSRLGLSTSKLELLASWPLLRASSVFVLHSSVRSSPASVSSSWNGYCVPGGAPFQHTNLRSLAWKDGDWWEPFAIGATIMQNGIINKLSQESVLVRLPAF